MDPLIGKTVSINLKRGPFFGVGSLWLSIEVPYGEIPADLSPEELEIVRKALITEDIYLGRRKTAAVDKDKKVLAEYVQKLKDTIRCTKAYKESIVQLIKKGRTGGYKPQEIIDVLLTAERNGRNREKFVDFLTEAKEVATKEYPDFLEKMAEDTSAAYDVFINPETKEIVAHTKKEEGKGKKRGRKSAQNKVGKKAKKADVDKAFGG